MPDPIITAPEVEVQPELPGIVSMLEAKDPVVETPAEPPAADEPPAPQDALDTPTPKAQEDENLRVMLREMRKQNALLSEQVQKLTKAATSEEGTVDLSVPGEIESLQNEITQIGEKNAVLYETLVETMALNPAFADVREVCTQEHLEDIIEMATKNIVAKQGGNPTLVALELEKQIWTERNPYKTMYEYIKSYHPKYAQTQAPAQKPADAMPQKRTPTPAVAPTSIASLGGGDGDKQSGWTAAKIDSLPELELSKVPKDVYEAYLTGQLN